MVQAEIDAAAELIDFFRFNAKHAVELEQQQPLDAQGSANTMLYRGLEVGGPHCCPLQDWRRSALRMRKNGEGSVLTMQQ